MNKNKRFDIFYMKFAVEASNFSYCIRKKVGALFIKDDIMVIGYNGTQPGAENCCEGEDGETLPEVMHAESNALGKITSSTLSSAGGTMYCTLSPCINCAKLLIQAKVFRFVYIRDHSDQTGLNMMRRAGILVERMDMPQE